MTRLRFFIVGFCPERDVLFHQLTVEENLWFFAKLKDCPSDQVKQEVDRMIDRLSLADKRDTRTGELPIAMKRKLSVGIALIGNSKVLSLFSFTLFTLVRMLPDT